MLSKKPQRSSTLQEEGLTNEGKHPFLLLHKQLPGKRRIAQSLHAQNTPTRLFEEPLKVISYGFTFERLAYVLFF